MNFNAKENLGKTASRFPFIMVLTSTFLQGFLFTFLNGPPLFLILEQEKIIKISSLNSLLKDGIFPIWNCISQLGGNVFSIFLLLLVCLITGFLLNPIVRLTTIILIYISSNWGIKSLANRILKIELNLFTPVQFNEENYIPLLAWLLNKPLAKINWEWQLFQYYLYWSIFINTSIFSIISITLVKLKITLLEGIIFVVIIGGFSIFAIMHSHIMGKVHDYWIKQSTNDINQTEK